MNLCLLLLLFAKWYFWIEHTLNKDFSQNETKNSKDLYIFLYSLTTKQDLHNVCSLCIEENTWVPLHYSRCGQVGSFHKIFKNGSLSVKNTSQ